LEVTDNFVKEFNEAKDLSIDKERLQSQSQKMLERIKVVLSFYCLEVEGGLRSRQQCHSIFDLPFATNTAFLNFTHMLMCSGQKTFTKNFVLIKTLFFIDRHLLSAIMWTLFLC